VAVPVAALAVMVALLGACSSSHKKPRPSTTPSSTSAPTTSSADAAAIKAVYLKFVDPKVPVAQKADLIQDGAAFLPAMQAESSNPQAKAISLDVTDVKVTSANLAEVTFTLLYNGSALLTKQHGYAIRENGSWKVAGATLCGLLAAQGPNSVPKVCSQPAATSLPH
jgi:hypothetical protein